MTDTSRVETLLGQAQRTGGVQLIALARAVCLAVLVEPGLLRRARIQLVPGADAGTESDLWFSPLVLTRNTTGIVLDPDVLTLLRQQLAAEAADPRADDPGFADRARALVAGLHAGHPPAVQLEEQVVWEAVRHQGTAGSQIEARLRTAVKAMATDPGGGRDVARWAAQAWWRLPETARQTDAGRLLAVGAALRLGTAASVASFSNQMPASVEWLTPGESPAPVPIGVELTVDGVRFAEPAPDGLVLELPQTSPLLLEISWSDGATSHGEVMAVAPGTEKVLGTVAGPVTLRTLAGRRYRIELEIAEVPGQAGAFTLAPRRDQRRDEAQLGSLADTQTALLELASSAHQQLQDAVITLQRAADALDRAERSGAMPAGLSSWDYADQQATHEQLATSVTDLAADLESSSEQVLEEITKAETEAGRLSGRQFASHAPELASIGEAASGLVSGLENLLSGMTSARDDLRARTSVYAGYRVPADSMSRARMLIEQASSVAVSLKQQLDRAGIFAPGPAQPTSATEAEPGEAGPPGGPVGMVLAGGRVVGSAFAVSPELVMTAGHVVLSGGQAGGTLTYVPEGGEPIPVRRTEVDETLGAAVLRLPEPAPAVLQPAYSLATGLACRILAGSAAGVPATIATMTGGGFYGLGGASMRIGLMVDQDISQLAGLSGSPVVLDSAPDKVVGIVLEPGLDFLYAAMMQPVVVRFGLTGEDAYGGVGELLELPLTDGALPRVRDADPYRLGTAPSEVGDSRHRDDLYVPRDIDTALHQALNDQQFVVVAGAGRAGKTRTAFEAALAVMPDAGLVTPRPGALASLAGHLLLRTYPGRLLIWLDEMGRVLPPQGQLDSALLTGLLGARDDIVVLATLDTRQLNRLSTGRDGGDQSLLDRAYVIVLPALLSPGEQKAGERAYPDMDFASTGIGRAFARARQPGNAILDASDTVAAYRQLAASRPDVYEPDLADALVTWSSSVASQGQREQALAAAQEALVILRRLAEASPHDHLPRLADALENLADRYAEVGRLQDAIAAAGEAIDLARRGGAGEEPQTLSVRANLARWTGQAGDPAAARDQYTALLRDRERILGSDHPDTLTTRAALAYWTGKAGDPAAARDQYTALLPDRVRVLGPDHPRTLATRAGLARCTGQAGDPTAARDQYTALLADRIRVLGADHPDTLAARAALAYWTGRAGDPVAARDQYAALLADRERILGPDHPLTVTTRDNAMRWTREALRGPA